MKTAKKILIGVLIVILALALALFFGYSTVQVLKYLHAGQERQELTGTLIENAVATTPATPSESDSPLPEHVQPLPSGPETAPVQVDFDKLWEQNTDIVAWIHSPDTPIDYPIVQSSDNEYYLRRMINGKWNVGGSLFQDYRCSSGYTTWNTLIYGHYMRDGSMFGTLQNYKEQEYYNSNPVIYLLTPAQDFKVELFAGFTCDDDDLIYSFPQTDQERETLLESCFDRSDFYAPVPVDASDRILTLSTCSYAYDNARYVVVGKLIPLERAL